MKVEVIRAYAGFSVGAIIPDMPGGQARTLIERGYIRDASGVAAKQAQAPVNRMTQAPLSRNQTKPILKLR